MNVELVRVDNAFHFEATGASGHPVQIDAAQNIGGNNMGSRPMELLLMGLGGCTAIDVILILQKQRQQIQDLKISLTGERVKIEGTEMTPFRTINIHFTLEGELDANKVKRAIVLSMEKYCSATAQFQESAKITHTATVNGVNLD
jgi:putative redox protein